MSKLHELLAILSNTQGQFAKVSADQSELFTKKQHHFTKSIVTFTPIGENVQSTTESQLNLQTTVGKELKWFGTHLAKYIDTTHSISKANTEAKADVIVDGATILTGIPATSLLELEKQINAFKAVAALVPTLDPAKGFELDKNEGEGVYKARLIEKNRTLKTKVVISLAKATDKHPEQVQLVDEDRPTGKIEESNWSSAMTPADKAALLERVEELLRAVKSARSRANDQQVTVDKIGDAVVKFLLKQ